MLMPATAVFSYDAVWQLRNNLPLVETLYWSFVTLQIITGAAAFIWAWRKARSTGDTQAWSCRDRARYGRGLKLSQTSAADA